MNKFRPFTFLHINDHHIGTPRSYRFRPAINRRWAAIKRQISETDADLLLLGGDLTRDGATHEFEYQNAREDLETLPFPFFTIPGNMDVGNKHAATQGPDDLRDDVSLNMTSDRLQLFSSYFGPINWSFLHKGVRFTGFYAAVAGTGLREEARFWRFMERLPRLPKARYHVAMMHYWLYMDALDEPNPDMTRADQYDSWYFTIDQPHRGRIFQLLKAAHVDVLFCGHVHTGRPVEVVDGIRIYKASAAGNTAQLEDRWDKVETRQGFHLCRVTEEALAVTYVPGSDLCEEFGTYGQWGHPKLADRDYTIAREKPALSVDPWLLKQ